MGKDDVDMGVDDRDNGGSRDHKHSHSDRDRHRDRDRDRSDKPRDRSRDRRDDKHEGRDKDKKHHKHSREERKKHHKEKKHRKDRDRHGDSDAHATNGDVDDDHETDPDVSTDLDGGVKRPRNGDDRTETSGDEDDRADKRARAASDGSTAPPPPPLVADDEMAELERKRKAIENALLAKASNRDGDDDDDGNGDGHRRSRDDRSRSRSRSPRRPDDRDDEGKSSPRRSGRDGSPLPPPPPPPPLPAEGGSRSPRRDHRSSHRSRSRTGSPARRRSPPRRSRSRSPLPPPRRRSLSRSRSRSPPRRRASPRPRSRTPPRRRSRSRTPPRRRSRTPPRRRSRSRTPPRRRSRTPLRRGRSPTPPRRYRPRSRSPPSRGGRYRSRTPPRRPRSRSPPRRSYDERRLPPPPPPRDAVRSGDRANGTDRDRDRDRDGDRKRDEKREEKRKAEEEEDEEEVDFPDTGDEEEDEEAAIERARLRRQAILAKHDGGTPATPAEGHGIGSATVAPEIPSVASAVPSSLRTSRAASSTTDSPMLPGMDTPDVGSPTGLSPDDLPATLADSVDSPSDVTDAPEGYKKVILHRDDDESGTGEHPFIGGSAARAAEPEQQHPAMEQDIFGSFDVEAAANIGKVGHTKDHKDTWADSEGYYKISPGEILDGRYRVRGYSGSGVFSNVVQAVDTKSNDTLVAIKIIRNNELMYNAGKKELEIIRILQAADKDGKYHCVKFLRHFMHKGHLCMVFESCAMNLREVTKKYGRDDGEVVGLSMEAVRKYAQQLLLALRLMRKCKIVHADIKPDNILVNDAKTQVKLCDFGSACLADECEITEYLQSRFYRAPEIALGAEYDYGIDMWSLATTLFELYTGRILFQDNKNNNQLLKQHMDLKGKPSLKFIRKGTAKDKHFDEDLAFLHHDIDPVTKNEKIRRLTAIVPNTDLMLKLKKNQKLDEAQKRKLMQFKDLLDKMLVLDPSKRITPKEALQHDFVKTPL